MLKMKKFPVKIDLSTFFEDERKYVIILVDPQWKNVEYLQHRVEEIFDVRPVRFLTTDNLFIPPQESIEVVEFTESLKAFIPKQALEESRRRSKQLKPETQVIVNNVEESIEKNLVKKRKYYTLGMDIQGSSTPNQTKKSRHTPKIVNQSPVEITSTNEQLNILKGCEQVQLNKSVEKKSICDGAKSLPSLVEKQSVTTNESKENSSKSSKRKRKRTHKERSALSMDFEEEKTELTLRPEVPSSTFLNNSKSSHIYFEDPTIMESKSKNQQKKSINKSTTNGKANTTIVSFKCKRSDAEFEKPVVFPLKYINKNNQPLKSIIDIQENILLQPANVDILCKAPLMNDTENQLEENVLSTTFNTTENKENGKIHEITNIAETADNFEPEKIANIITNGLDHINCKLVRDSGTEKEIQNNNTEKEIQNNNTEKEIQNNNTEKEIQNNNLKENSNCEGSINDEKGTITNDNSNCKDKNVSNQSQAEISYNEYNLNKEVQETVSSIDKIKQTNMTSTNMTEMSDYSQLMDESSVIDLDDDDEVVIDLSDADDQQKSLATSRGKLSVTLNKSISIMSIDEMLNFCVPLTGIPELGDVIIFKFNRRVSGAKIDESQFIACRCEHINKRTKALKLAVINASLENDVLPQKYKYSLDDTFEIRFMNIKFTEMIDPKVLKLNS